MNFVNCEGLASVLMCCSVAVLVIVNGQSTTDDDIDTVRVANCGPIDIVAELRTLRTEQIRLELWLWLWLGLALGS